jgi:LysR family transcriptional regulator, benzoate and cis,cis-muconate-responsive activator of ben and cat genes
LHDQLQLFVETECGAGTDTGEMLCFDQLITFCYQLNMTDIRQCRAFIAVAEELNFHRAAEKLGTVQPALSRLIGNLEKDLKVQLLERTTRHVSLTEPGKIFLIEARALVSHMASAVRTTQSAGMGTAGTLTLAYMDFAVHKLLPDLLSVASKTIPEIRIDLTYMSTAQQRLALMDGKADMGLMIGQMSNPFVDSICVANEPLIVGLPATHRLQAKRGVNFADIIHEPLLIGNDAEWSAFRDILFRLYAQQGGSPSIAVEASSAAALLGLAAKGMGVTFYAGIPTLYQGSGLVFRPILPKSTIPISLVWRKGAKLPIIRQVLKAAGLAKT